MGYIRLFSDEFMKQSELTYKGFCELHKMKQIVECPVCKTTVLFEALCDIGGGAGHQCLILECPNCYEIIAVIWENPDDDNMAASISHVFPQNAKDRIFEKEISDMSPNFVNTYNQSNAAETYGLNEIAGMGYRKAMEYLIKDYAVKKYPKEKNLIMGKALSKCIEDYVSEPKIKTMAKGAVWLGNDETHYLRKWVDKDISDMKNMIDLTLYWMNFERMTEEYRQNMKL